MNWLEITSTIVITIVLIGELLLRRKGLRTHPDSNSDLVVYMLFGGMAAIAIISLMLFGFVDDGEVIGSAILGNIVLVARWAVVISGALWILNCYWAFLPSSQAFGTQLKKR